MKKTLLVIMLLVLPGCISSHLAGYNLKASIGQTDYQDGNKSLYTGASIDAHFDVTR